jgi:hypothetical protein
MKRWSLVARCLTLLFLSDAHGAENVVHCALGQGRTHSIELFRTHPIADTAVYYLAKDGGAETLLYRGEKEQSRGGDVRYECSGARERVLVVSGEFTSDYLQGVAIRYNSASAEWERIDFAERARPARIDLLRTGMLVVIPNLGHETGKKYLIYRYIAGKGQEPKAQASDTLPEPDGAEVVLLKK